VLTAEEQREIEEEVRKYQQRRAAGPEALRIVQGHRGWISDECLRDVARFLGMTDDELDSVATCYNLIFRQQVGRHVILLCDGVCCWIMGHDDIRDYLTDRLGIALGQTTSDGRFTLLPISCIGACDKAPALIIDGKLYCSLTRENIDTILQEHP
jgi:NADH-quinone oxidoreductase subunit E